MFILGAGRLFNVVVTSFCDRIYACNPYSLFFSYCPFWCNSSVTV